jgi:hypothetical protein
MREKPESQIQFWFHFGQSAVFEFARFGPLEGLRNNNQKVAVDVEDYNWHLLLWGVPSESRHVLQKHFEDTAAESLGHWLVHRKSRTNHAKVWWHPDTQRMLVDFR